MGLVNAIGGALWSAGWQVGRAVGSIRNSENTLTAMTVDQLAEAIRQANHGGPSHAGINVTPDRAMQQATVNGCVRVLRESVAQLPLGLFRRDPADHRRIEPARDDPRYRLLRVQPNSWQTSFEWREMVMTDLLFRGNHYSRVVRGAGQRVLELLRYHPDRVRVEQDEASMRLTYRIERAGGGSETLDQDEVLHVRGPGWDGICGVTPMRWLRETVGDALAAQEHTSRFWSNGAKPGTILTAAGKIPAEAKTALRDDFESLYRGLDNIHRTAVLDQGIKVETLQMSNEDAQFLELRRFSRTDICAMFGVPPHMVGDLERATFSNIEQQALEFVQQSLMFWLVRIEQALWRDLLRDPQLAFKFNVDGLLRGAFKDRQQGLQIQRRNGIINANEWREREDLNPRDDEGGDEYIVERNMGPQPEEAEPAAAPAGATAGRARKLNGTGGGAHDRPH